MAIIKAVSSHAPISVAIDYVTRGEKTEMRLMSGVGVSVETAKDEMQATKELYGKTRGRTYKHFVQSFAPGENISPEKANKIANELVDNCKLFDGYEVLIATHKDREHVHSHFIVNSVNYETGNKFQMSSKDLQEMKNISDGICQKYGLSICEKGKTFEGEERKSIVAWTKEKYQFLKESLNEKKGKSYINEIAQAVTKNMKFAKDRDDFCRRMEKSGIMVVWQDNRKHITFMDEAGNKLRDSNLLKTFNLDVSKEGLNKQFEKNLDGLSSGRKNQICSDLIKATFKRDYYTAAKKDIEKQILERKSKVEVPEEKYRKTDYTIRQMQNDIKKWQEELKKCSVLQRRKKTDLTQKIKHAKVYMESLSADCDATMKRYGYESAEQLKLARDDLRKSVKITKTLTEKIQKEEKTISQLTPKLEKLGIGMELTVEDKEVICKELGDALKTKINTSEIETIEKKLQPKENASTDRDKSMDETKELAESKEEIAAYHVISYR